MDFNIYTIAAENPFLRVLADWLLKHVHPLQRATILVPNRRSARALEAVLLQLSGKQAMLLPTIKPIGDIDEDLVADSLPEEGIADALPKTSHLHVILDILMQWARNNLQSDLAQEVSTSGAQGFTLAQSLQQLVNQFETEDVKLEQLEGLYNLAPDLAGHRQNILELLKIITRELPKKLDRENFIGPSARRNAMIRMEAHRIASGQHKGPIIAAGSTGTNPATRDLLHAIARNPLGTVVLPGLDMELDDVAWHAITSEHPQFSLKSMLDQWGLNRHHVQTMGEAQAQRMWVMGQAMRPAAVAEQWIETLKGQKATVEKGLQNVDLVEAADRQQETDIIALALRRHVESSSTKAALMTPDRDLATRVTAALQRWNINIDDSAGEPLVHSGKAALLVLLLQAIENKFSSASLFALLYHADCNFGLSRDMHLERVRALELIAYRGQPEADGLPGLVDRIARQKSALQNAAHVHPLVKALSEDDWIGAAELAAQLHALLTPLCENHERSLHDHIHSLLSCLESVSIETETTTAADQLFFDIMISLQEGSVWHPVLSLSKTQHSIIHALSSEMLRPPFNPDNQLTIYGLAEARLVDVDFLILGGLTEGSWPAHPDTGPWLNRPMRDTLKLQQPERDIGVTAHDFVQGFGHTKIMLTWPKRLQGAPAIASRWILRLQAVATAAGLDVAQLISTELPRMAAQLDHVAEFRPIKPPRPKPPVKVRPTKFSVTRIEKLVRDSYHIYAQQILKLHPLEPLGQDVDARLRGSLIHHALQEWSNALPQVPESEHHHLLLLKGRESFAPYLDMPEVSRFWWPRFKKMAADFMELHDTLREGVIATRTEIDGHFECLAGDVLHLLTARADRIDVLEDGGLRIIDYKSGKAPSIKQVQSGFAPQLSLEALIAAEGRFKQVNSNKLSDVMFIPVGGGRDELKSVSLAKSTELATEIAKAKAGLMALLTDYQNPDTAYHPRHNMEKTSDVSDYDHLSRKLEWQLEGTAL